MMTTFLCKKGTRVNLGGHRRPTVSNCRIFVERHRQRLENKDRRVRDGIHSTKFVCCLFRYLSYDDCKLRENQRQLVNKTNQKSVKVFSIMIYKE